MAAYNIEPTSTTWETSQAHDPTQITDVPTDGASCRGTRMLLSKFPNCSKLTSRIFACLETIVYKYKYVQQSNCQNHGLSETMDRLSKAAVVSGAVLAAVAGAAHGPKQL